MKRKIILFFVLLICGIKLFGQEKQNLNFVLLINDDVPEYGIFDGEFQIADSTGKIIEQFSFDYSVGRLVINTKDYSKLFTQSVESKIIIKFVFKDPYSNYKEFFYVGEIPTDKMNYEHIICHIYDFSKTANKLKYVFDGKKYLFQISIPAWSVILKTWNKSTSQKVRLNQH